MPSALIVAPPERPMTGKLCWRWKFLSAASNVARAKRSMLVAADDVG
jgi:hypothetical protein